MSLRYLSQQMEESHARGQGETAQVSNERETNILYSSRQQDIGRQSKQDCPCDYCSANKSLYTYNEQAAGFRFWRECVSFANSYDTDTGRFRRIRDI